MAPKWWGHFLSDEELSQLTPAELEEYIKEKEDWLKADLQQTLNPFLFKSPVGVRQCAADNCVTREFRRTGYCLDHRNTKFFDTFEVNTPGIGTTVFIAKKVHESDNRSDAALVGAGVFVGLSIYETAVSMLPDRLELIWRGITGGAIIGFLLWLLVMGVISGQYDTDRNQPKGDFCEETGNCWFPPHVVNGIIVKILGVITIITLVPLSASAGAMFGFLRYESEEKKYLDQISIRRSEPGSANKRQTMKVAQSQQPTKQTRPKLIRCKHFFEDESDILYEGKTVRCSNFHPNERYCDEHGG